MELARDFFERWMAHNAELASRKLDDDLAALEAEMVVKGLRNSGWHIKAAIKLGNECVTSLCKLASDKVSTLPELGNDTLLVREPIAAFAQTIIQRLDGLAARVIPGGLTDGVRKEMRDLQKPITTDLSRALDLAAMERRLGQFRPPHFAGWDGVASRAAFYDPGIKMPSSMHYLQAAAWCVFRDSAAMETTRIAVDRLRDTPGAFQSPAAIEFQRAVLERRIPVYGLNAEQGWQPVPADAFLQEEFTLGPSKLEAYGDLYVMRGDLLAVFPPDSPSASLIASAPRKPEPPPPQPDTRKPVPRGVLEGWWNTLGNDRDSLSVVELWALAKATYPTYRVTRASVRRLGPARKRGRKGSTVI